MEPMLKAPRTKRLKLQYDEPPSNFAFKFNLRRYISGARTAGGGVGGRERGGGDGRVIGRYRYIAEVKCPYRVAGKVSALRAGKRAPG